MALSSVALKASLKIVPKLPSLWNLPDLAVEVSQLGSSSSLFLLALVLLVDRHVIEGVHLDHLRLTAPLMVSISGLLGKDVIVEETRLEEILISGQILFFTRRHSSWSRGRVGRWQY